MDLHLLEIIITVVGAVLASSGFWAFIQHHTNKNNNSTKMLVGIGHDRIVYLGMQYIERGSITHDEYENLITYLYEPYEALGGNGTAEKVVNEVKKLPITKTIVPKVSPSSNIEL